MKVLEVPSMLKGVESDDTYLGLREQDEDMILTTFNTGEY